MLFGQQKPRGLFGGGFQQQMQNLPMGQQQYDAQPTPMQGGMQHMMGAQASMPTQPMVQDMQAGLPKQPGTNWLAVLADGLAGAAGMPATAGPMLMRQRDQQHQEQMAQQKRANDWQDFTREYDYKAAHPAPTNNDTVNDFNFYKNLSEPDKAIYDTLHPVTVMGPDGPYVVPRSSIGGGANNLPPIGSVVPDPRKGGAAGYAGGGGFPAVTPRGLDAITVNSESGGNPNAVSPKGARGLWQVMPETARDPGFGIRPSNGTQADDARVGQEYRQAMQQRYGGNLPAMWGAYNWGPGAVDKARATYGEDWLSHAPAETRAYVNKNMQMVRGR